MKKLLIFLTVIASLIVFNVQASTAMQGHKHKRSHHHYKAHKMGKPHGRIDATYQN